MSDVTDKNKVQKVSLTVLTSAELNHDEHP